MHKLSSLKVSSLKPASNQNTARKLADGGGLYLYLAPTGAKNWVFRYTISGKERNMGLGSFPDVSLAEARDVASTYRKIKRNGVDPLIHRENERRKRITANQQGVTFTVAAQELIDSKKAGWKNVKHAAQWTSTLQTYAYPTLGEMPVDQITVSHVLRVLKPIWESKSETATRVRQRVESVLDASTALGYRTGDNPARWRGHLDKLLPERSTIKKVVHHPALPYRDAPVFMKDLMERDSIGAKALQFTILTACRTSEVIHAKWDEIDLDAATWTIPEERMKAKKIHRVPLSDTALSIVSGIEKVGDYVFYGARPNRPISDNTMRKLLQQTLGYQDLVVHGFRSSFRDWCSEETHVPNIVAEMALAHSIDSKVESSYRRGDLFARRATLMQAWASYLSAGSRPASIVPFKSSEVRL